MMVAVRRLVIVLTLALSLAVAGQATPCAYAGDDRHGTTPSTGREHKEHSKYGGDHSEARENRHDQNDARGALQRGEIKSLVDILMAIKDKLPGEVIGVEIERNERKKQGWLYEFRVIGKNGRLYEVYVDGFTAEVVKTKMK